MSDTACPVCGQDFTAEKGVRDHAWDVHGACHHCSREFETRADLYTHWLEDHEGDLSDADRKRAENRVTDLTVCPACEDRFGSASAVRDHAWDAHGVCHHCGDGFADEETLAAHWLGAHGSDLSRATRERAEAVAGDLSFGQRLTHQGPLAAVGGIRVSRRALMGGGAVGAVALLGGAAATGAFGSLGGGGGQGLGSHPASRNLAQQPRLGPPPTEAAGTIIAFEDPSCPSCARFERRTFPELRRRLIEPGTVSFVFRAIPVVNPWGRPATLALEAVHVRDASAFWGLKTFYYQNQRRIGSNNVLEETRAYLADRTDLDADAVITDVQEGTYQPAVRSNLQAARKANLQGTPTFYLFKEEAYRTRLVGPQGIGVFRNALGV